MECSFLEMTPIMVIYFLKYSLLMDNNSMFVILALVAALGLVGVVAVNIMLTAQEAEAAKSRTGQCASTLKNASAQICHRS